MLYRALIKTHHMTSLKKVAAIRSLTKQHGCIVYFKSGPRTPAVLVAEKDWGPKQEWRELRRMEDAEEERKEREKVTGETVLREWVKGVKVCKRGGFLLLISSVFCVSRRGMGRGGCFSLAMYCVRVILEQDLGFSIGKRFVVNRRRVEEGVTV